jgi:tetratricopeptide (TPR) repeat protein
MAHAKKKKVSASKSGPVQLPVISVREFAGRFANGVRETQQPFTWFLGAGCSKSSGILDAGGLVQKWVKELFELQGHSGKNFETWTKAEFPSFDPINPSLFYARAFSRRYPSPGERQREIEMICSRGEPAYGYATLAQLLSKDYGRFCNTVLTTNFDDLIADALYLYGTRNVRPLVVTHEALARYVRTNSPRPTVVKLHGDAHLDPKNLQPETREIDVGLAKQLSPFLQDHALIFVGYGGNDESILKFVRECPVAAVAPPIYWISRREPPLPFAHWLHERNALRVDHTDFDQLMHLVRNALGIELLDRSRWTQIGDAYYEAFEKLRNEIDSVNASAEDTEALRAATSEAAKSLPDDWSYVSHAREFEKLDKSKATSVFKEGLDKFPNSAILTGSFASFLNRTMSDFDAAEIYYKKAIEIDPKRAANLGNYALFLKDRRGNMDEAEMFYKRALEADPQHANNLSNYANFLDEVRKDLDAAEALYKRAIEADPKHATSLANYARFLDVVRNDYDNAETFYKRSFEIDSTDAFALGNYAVFLESVRKSVDEAEVFYERAIQAEPKNASNLGNYADFVEKTRKNFDGAETFYKRALEADPNHLFSLRRYADFLEKVRNDPKSAEPYRARIKNLET